MIGTFTRVTKNGIRVKFLLIVLVSLVVVLVLIVLALPFLSRKKCEPISSASSCSLTLTSTKLVQY